MITIENNRHKSFRINIFGSCVTRDILEYDKKNFTAGEYIARESIISFLSNPFFFHAEDILLPSTFQRKQLIQDLEKSGLKKLKSNPGDLLVIDFIEERFDIGKVNGTYITISNEWNQSNLSNLYFVKKYSKKLWHGKVYFRFKNLKKYIHIFTKNLLSIYKEEQIVIHEVYLADTYIDENGIYHSFSENVIYYNKKINQILRYMYFCLKTELPQAYILNISDKYAAKKNHKWGLAPMHFQEEYYKNAAGLIYTKLAYEGRVQNE